MGSYPVGADSSASLVLVPATTRTSLTAEVVATITLTVASISFAISFAVLIFGGALEQGLHRAVGSFVVGSGVLAVAVAARSSIVPVATFLQEAPAILLAAVAADFIAQQDATVTDVFVLLAVTMVATALVSASLGFLHLGGMVQYLPKPVVAAFIGGTGWLLLKGGIEVMTNGSIRIADLGRLVGWQGAKFWIPGVALGFLAWLANRSSRVPSYALGLTIAAAVAGFYITVWITSSVAAVEASGWLLGPFPESGGAQLITPHELATTNWAGIAKMAPGIAAVVALSCVAQLFSLTGIRAEIDPRLDVDGELRTCAGANLAAALFGATPGFQGLGYTVLVSRLGAARRAAGVVSGLFVVGFGLLGVALVGYVPRLMVGALLVLGGLALLEVWATGWVRCAVREEQLLGAAVVAAIAWQGLVWGIVGGLLAAGGVFIIRASQLDPVRASTTGRAVRSRVDRTAHEERLLHERGDRLSVIQMQGYVFFGSLTKIDMQVRAARTTSASGVVIDFASVTGIDSSACSELARLLCELQRAGAVIWVSAADATITQRLLLSEPALVDRIVCCSSLDTALEYAEDHLLAPLGRPLDLRQPTTTLSPELVSECEFRRFEQGTVFMALGKPVAGLFIVRSGSVTSYRVDPDGRRIRLRGFGPMTVVGEIGALGGSPCRYEAIADTTVDGWWLSIGRFQMIRNRKPWLALELYEYIGQSSDGRSNPSPMLDRGDVGLWSRSDVTPTPAQGGSLSPSRSIF